MELRRITTAVLPNMSSSGNITLAYLKDATADSSFVAIARNGDVREEADVARVALTQGFKAATSLEETSVVAMAIAKMLKIGDDGAEYGMVSGDQMGQVLSKWGETTTKTLESTKGHTMFGPEGPGYKRRLYFEEASTVMRKHLADFREALKDSDSLTSRAIMMGNATKLIPGSSIIYITAVIAAADSRGAGGAVLDEILAFADATGTVVVLSALAMDGLPWTFYAQRGFQVAFYKDFLPEKETFDPVLMMRAPDSKRRVEAATLPTFNALALWGRNATDRFLPPSAGKLKDAELDKWMNKWDKSAQLRGLDLIEQKKANELFYAPRPPTWKQLPGWGQAVNGVMTHESACRILVAMGAKTTVAGADDEMEAKETTVGTIPLASETGKRAREEDDDTTQLEMPPAQRSRPAEDASTRVSALIVILANYPDSTEFVLQALTGLQGCHLSYADATVVTNVGAKHASDTKISLLAMSIVRDCLTHWAQAWGAA
jgi:hypothetical protein